MGRRQLYCITYSNLFILGFPGGFINSFAFSMRIASVHLLYFTKEQSTQALDFTKAKQNLTGRI